MSRLAKKPINITSGVTLTIDDSMLMKVSASGKTLEHRIHPAISYQLESDTILFDIKKGSEADKSQLGTTAAVTKNMIEGVSKGFSKKLKLVGVGYRASMEGTTLVMLLGYSHPVRMAVPEGLSVKLEGQTTIEVHGIDKQKVGQFSAIIRSKRPPEPYKGKGVRYIDEEILLKEGKKK